MISLVDEMEAMGGANDEEDAPFLFGFRFEIGKRIVNVRTKRKPGEPPETREEAHARVVAELSLTKAATISLTDINPRGYKFEGGQIPPVNRVGALTEWIEVDPDSGTNIALA